MKKTVCLIISLVLFSVSLVGCERPKPVKNRQLNIITTDFSTYDWTVEILGEKRADYNVSMLYDRGTDMHSFEPTAVDVVNISLCDMFVFEGGQSEEWIEKTLSGAENKDKITVNIIEELKDIVKTEETVEGMQEEKHHTDGENEIDEHIWLSVRNAEKAVSVICEKLSVLDQKNSAVFKKNTERYIENLRKIDGEYRSAVENAENKTLVFGDRFPFRYLADDYGLKYYAAFSGCSAESEAGFKTVMFLAEKIDENNLSTVLTIDNSNNKIADTVIENTKQKNQKILSLNSLQSVSKKDIENGLKYTDVFMKNLEVLKTALKTEE